MIWPSAAASCASSSGSVMVIVVVFTAVLLGIRSDPSYQKVAAVAMVPARALAATVSGWRGILSPPCDPWRPGKLRFVVLMQLMGVFNRPKVSDGPPRHAAQEASPIFAPAARKMSRETSRRSSRCPAREHFRRRRDDEGVDLHRLAVHDTAAALKSAACRRCKLPM